MADVSRNKKEKNNILVFSQLLVTAIQCHPAICSNVAYTILLYSLPRMAGMASTVIMVLNEVNMLKMYKHNRL